MSLALKKLPPRPPKADIAVFPPMERFHHFTVSQYHQMIEAGILGENDRVELLEGWIIAKMTHNPPHDATIQLVHEGVAPHLPLGWVIRIQSAITLGKSEPEPDLAIVRGPIRRYVKAHPVPRDIGCLMEVAETSVEEDRDYKGPMYARALIPVYWLINLPENQIEVYSQPRGGRKPRYASRQDYGIGDMISQVLDGREIAHIALRDLLP